MNDDEMNILKLLFSSIDNKEVFGMIMVHGSSLFRNARN